MLTGPDISPDRRVQFVETIAALARAHDVSLVSFLWAQYLFACPHDRSPASANQAAVEAMRAGESTAAAEAFARVSGGS